MEKKFFTDALAAWFDPAARPMPWKNERDPYRIWLSEIILQQTRVEQGLPYFSAFTEAFPTVEKLARASEQEVFKLWQGLGYYSRARNLHATARHVFFDLNGSFPTSYEGLKKLKGVGPYTAAAIASFAFDEPRAVLDGNVFRVLSRFFGIETPTDSTEGKRLFQQLADEVLDFRNPARHNQAMMDFGATVCIPARPMCEKNCPLRKKCLAFLNENVLRLPVKSKALAKRDRFFHFFIFEKKGRIWLRERTEKDIWRGLFEPPMIETDRLETTEKGLRELIGEHFLIQNFRVKKISQPMRQTLTHQRIAAVFVEAEIGENEPFEPPRCIEIDRIDIKKMPLPRLVDLYFSSAGELHLDLR